MSVKLNQWIRKIGIISLILATLIGCSPKEPGHDAAQKAAQDTNKAVNEAGQAMKAQVQTLGNQIKQETNVTTKSVQKSLGDTGISSKVQAKLIADPLVGDVGIDVKSEKGVVTLQGRVKDKLTKSRAIQDAQSVQGVTKVVSKLTINK